VPYFLIDNFKAGVDTRFPVFAADPGTLGLATDLHLTTAGHPEKRKAFVPHATLPAGTFGLAQRADTVYVFGSVPGPPGLPTGFGYQRLQHPTGAVMTDLLDVELFDGKFYTIAAFTSDVVHFFDGARGADWLVSTDAADADAFTGGRAARTLGEKVYVVDGANVNFSAVGAPLHFKTEGTTPANVGAGFINMSIHSAGSETLVGVELYYDSLAVFSKENVQLWHMTANPTTNARIQTLRGAGLVAPRAAISYLDGDTIFLSYQGVKSISPRDNVSGRSLIKHTSAPVDKELLPFQQGLPPDVLQNAMLIQEPENNRLWVILGDRIYVLNHFPDTGVHAWTTYLPGFTIDAAIVCDLRLYVRSGDQIYLYGGPDNDQYFEGQAVARIPYVTARVPSTIKDIQAFDAGVEGTWEVWISLDPANPAAYVRTAIITGETFTDPNYPLSGSTTHISMEFRHTGAEYARLSAVALHYDDEVAG
jgi:hypothetical protein